MQFPKLNPWQLIVGLAVVLAVPTALALTGKLGLLGGVVAGAGLLLNLLLSAHAPSPPAIPVVPEEPPTTPRNIGDVQ